MCISLFCPSRHGLYFHLCLNLTDVVLTPHRSQESENGCVYPPTSRPRHLNISHFAALRSPGVLSIGRQQKVILIVFVSVFF